MKTPNRLGNGTGSFLTGALVGGLVTYVATNPAVQRALVVGAAQAWLAVKGSMEETKERFRDAEAEIKTARAK